MSDNLTYKKVNNLKGNNKIFYDTFIQAGYKPVQAFGMIGNLMYESGGYDDINPSSYQKGGGGGFGAAQWTDPKRKQGLQLFANELNMSIHNPRAQALYIIHELENSYARTGIKLKQANDTKTAMEIFLKEYEAPKSEHQRVGSESYNKRLQFSNQFLVNPEIKMRDWNWKTKTSGVNVKNLDNNIVQYLHTLEPEYQDYILATAGSDGNHSENSRHYSSRAVDLRFNQKLYDRVHKDPMRLKYGITLLDPNHGTAPHLHLSVGDGSENKKDVWINPHSDEARGIVNSLQIDNSEIQQPQEQESSTYQQSQGESDSVLLAHINALNKKLEEKDEKSAAEVRNQQIRNKLIQKQQERDFIMANILATKLPFVERGY